MVMTKYTMFSDGVRRSVRTANSAEEALRAFARPVFRAELKVVTYSTPDGWEAAQAFDYGRQLRISAIAIPQQQ